MIIFNWWNMLSLLLLFQMLQFSVGDPNEWPQISIRPDPPLQEQSQVFIECSHFEPDDIELHFLSNNSELLRNTSIIFKDCAPQFASRRSTIFKYVRADCPRGICTIDTNKIKICRYSIANVSWTLNNGKFWCEFRSSQSTLIEFQVFGTICYFSYQILDLLP